MLPLPAGADGGNYALRSQPDPQAIEEEQYFETVPQGLDSADSSTAPRLGALLEGPKGKQIQQVSWQGVGQLAGGAGRGGLPFIVLLGARVRAGWDCLPGVLLDVAFCDVALAAVRVPTSPGCLHHSN